jgi:ABC-2 type transport system permease protein
VAEAFVLWHRLVGAQVRSQLQYRASFALDAIGSFLISFLDFFAVLIIFHNVPRLGAWDVHEVAFLYAISMISFALTDLVIGHLDQLPQKVRDGNFDLLLVRPRGTLLQVTALDFQLRRLGKALQGVVFASVWVVGSTISFWTTESGEFTNAFTYGGNFLTEYPIDIYSSWARRFLAYLIPLGFVAYFPALYILDKPDPLGLPRVLEFISPLVALVSAVVAGAVWRFAVRHYRSAGG